MTSGLGFLFGGVEQWVLCGALWVTKRQYPSGSEGLGELGEGLSADAGLGTLHVVVLPPGCEAWFRTGNRVTVKWCSWDFTPSSADGFHRPLETPLCRAIRNGSDTSPRSAMSPHLVASIIAVAMLPRTAIGPVPQRESG